MLTSSQLKAIIPLSTDENLKKFIQPLNAAAAIFRINTPLRLAAFIAQLAWETESLSKITESTFYSNADRLIELFPHAFASRNEALNYIKNPERCANRIYAHKNGNGDEASGDGWKFRGRGGFQITGRSNYAECGKALGLLNLIEHPELLESPDWAVRSAGWFWNIHGCNELADVGMFGGITRKIDGGYNGAMGRLAFFGVAKKVLSA